MLMQIKLQFSFFRFLFDCRGKKRLSVLKMKYVNLLAIELGPIFAFILSLIIYMVSENFTS